MIKLYVPQYKDLWFRQMFMADEETMSYNHNWGGTIPFPEEEWNDWYCYWIINTEGKQFYRYLVDDNNNEFVGEIAYHYDEVRKITIADIIIFSKYRGKGFGKQGLNILCDMAKENGIDVLYDDIAIDNTAINLFIECGFEEDYRTNEYVMLKRVL